MKTRIAPALLGTSSALLRLRARAFFLAAVVLPLLLSARSTTFAVVSPTWDSSASTDWNTNANWTPATGYPGTGVGDTATFNNLSSVTSLFISATPANALSGITFTASETHAFTITVDATITLTMSGTGITNSSGITQNFVTAVDGAGNFGTIAFTGGATAGSKTAFTNTGSAFGGVFGGTTTFSNTSTAGSSSFTNNGGTVNFAAGGQVNFSNTSNAGSGTFTNNGGTVSGAFGGDTDFSDNSNAGSSTITSNAGTVSGAFAAETEFRLSSTAGSATLIANSGLGQGGIIRFFNTSTGGTARVEVFGGGQLDISPHDAGSVGIGSLEGSGHVFLGANNLSVGSNNLSTTFSGVMQNGGEGGGTGGSLTKTGTGTLTLSGANTYTGATMVNGGTLFVNGSITSNVTVNGSGTTLGGGVGATAGTITGTVTVNAGANLHPGTSPGILNTGSVTLASTSNFLVDINGPTVGTQYSQLNVTGTVMLGSSNLVLTVGGILTVGEQFTIVNNDLSDAVSGMFAQGNSVTSGADVFSINYAGGSNNNDVVLTVQAVPEPSTWVSGALALAFVGYSQRRRFARILRRV